jgi:predicted dehydrogenase
VFAAAREALAQGALGNLIRARCSMYRSDVFGPRTGWRFDPARSGGGVVANLAADLLFLLDWYLEPPLEVRATSKKLFGEVEDELHAMMRLRSGAEVGFDCSWSVPGYPRAAVVMELEGGNGKLLASDDALELDLVSDRGGQERGHTLRRRAELPTRARFDWDGEALYLQDASFLGWITGGGPPPGERAAALRVQRLIDALYRSAEGGGAAVEIGR